MIFRAVYTKEAAKQIRHLDGPVRERVRIAVERLSANPGLGKRLTGILDDRWSYRVGDWRILYRVFQEQLVILVLTVGHRREVYRA